VTQSGEDTDPATEQQRNIRKAIREAMYDTAGLARIPAPAPLVENVLFRDSLAWLYGPPGCFKSFIMLDIAGCGRAGDHMRGSIAMDGAANTILKVSRAEDIIELECVKQKDAPQFDPLSLRVVPYEPSIVISGTVGPRPSTVDSPSVIRLRLAWWNSCETDWVTPKLLGEVAGLPRTTLYRNITALVRAGMAETKGDGPARRCRLTRDPTVPSVPGFPTNLTNDFG
jgi:hypothetical protein